MTAKCPFCGTDMLYISPTQKECPNCHAFSVRKATVDEAKATVAIDLTPEDGEQKPFYTVTETARMLRLNPETIRRAIRAGKLQAVDILTGGKKKYLISALTITQFLQSRTKATAPEDPELAGIPTEEEMTANLDPEKWSIDFSKLNLQG